MSTTTWKLDPAHTDITFSAKHMMITTVRGTFADVEGTLEIDEADPRRQPAARSASRPRACRPASAPATRTSDPPTSSMSRRYPEIVVRFDGVELVKGDDYQVTADVTIRDVTRPLTFEVEHVGETTNFQGNRHIAFTAKATLNREDWGLNWNMALETGGWLVGKDIKLVVEVVADEVVAAGRAPSGSSVGTAA